MASFCGFSIKAHGAGYNRLHATTIHAIASRVSDRQYCYPDCNVLINTLGIIGAAALETADIELTQARIDQFEPDFDDITLPALRAIHFRLFQDPYDWAGDLRTANISKGSTRFANINCIKPEADKLYRQLAQEKYLTAPKRGSIQRIPMFLPLGGAILPLRVPDDGEDQEQGAQRNFNFQKQRCTPDRTPELDQEHHDAENEEQRAEEENCFHAQLCFVTMTAVP